MTKEYLQCSRDTFPLDFLEIQQINTRVLGEDLFGKLKLERHFVRLECERCPKSEQM